MLSLILAFGPQVQGPTLPPSASSQNFTVTVRSVLVDVVVTNAEGAPITNLRKQDFEIFEDSIPQPISSFEEHRAQIQTTRAAEIQSKAGPPNAFSNATATKGHDTLSVLLLDSINTPLQDQEYMHSQVIKCLKSIRPGSDVAIFTMSTTLDLVRGFTDNSSDLITALTEGKVWKEIRPSPFLNSGAPSGQQAIDEAQQAQQEHPSSATQGSIEALKHSQGEWDAFQLDQRINYTLANLRQLGRYLASLPGRKNVIWFSGSFPLSTNSLGSQNDWGRRYEEELRKTADILSASRVSLFPIDARGLAPDPFYSDASALPQGKNEAESQRQRRSQIENSIRRNAENATMEEWARETGGKAFFNTNGLAESAQEVIDLGGDYYTLSYTPTNKRMDGTFRSIRVKVRHSGYTLSYRRGYLAVDDKTRMTPTTGVPEDLLRSYVKPGMPNLDGLIYDITLLPETSITTANPMTLGDNTRVAMPLTRVGLHFAIRPDRLALSQTADGTRHCSLRMLVIAYSEDGVPLNWLSRTLAVAIPQERYKSIQDDGIRMTVQIDLPASTTLLATGLLDSGTMKAGTLQIPLHPASTPHE